MPAPTPPTGPAPAATPAAAAAALNPAELLRSRQYIVILLLSAIVGVPISLAAYGFIQLVDVIQTGLYDHLPHVFGYQSAPDWWAIPLLAVSGLAVGASITYLPGTGGHSPADGLQTGGPQPIELFGVLAAAIAGLGLGIVLGPEAPLLALGGGLGALAVHLAKRDAPPMASTVIAAAGSFAALGTIFGSPLIAAFFLMEAVGVGGQLLSLILVPGLLASGIGAMVFIGMGRWTGLGSSTLSLPGLPAYPHPTFVQLLWALAIGLVSAVLATGIRRMGLYLRTFTAPRMLTLTPVAGVAVGVLALVFAVITHKGITPVLFSGQSYLGTLVGHAATWSVGALLVLMVCKGLAYGISLSSFRGGPVFPSLLLGAAIGLVFSHLPGMSIVPAIAAGIGGMGAAMLRLPLASAMLAILLLAQDALAVSPIVIVSVVAAYVLGAWIAPKPAAPPPAPSPATTPSPAPAGG